MNVLPILGFYIKHNAQLGALATGDSTVGIDFANALVPVLKKHFPKLNDNGLLDDALATLHEVVGQPKTGEQ